MSAPEWIVGGIAAWLLVGLAVAALVMPGKRREIEEFFGVVDQPTFVLSCLFATLVWPVALWSHRHG